LTRCSPAHSAPGSDNDAGTDVLFSDRRNAIGNSSMRMSHDGRKDIGVEQEKPIA